MDWALTASRWDEEYRNRRYADEPPLPFVDEIIAVLKADRSAWNGAGLYVGCGNGRNYLPLVDAGLNLVGLDLSPEAIKSLAQRRPTLPPQRLLCEDFRAFQSPPRRFEYVIALQVFQHGVVRKRRTVYLVGRTRVHLDDVEGLGTFVELEVVVGDSEPAAIGIGEARDLMAVLGIRDEQLVSNAYVDLLQERARGNLSAR